MVLASAFLVWKFFVQTPGTLNEPLVIQNTKSDISENRQEGGYEEQEGNGSYNQESINRKSTQRVLSENNFKINIQSLYLNDIKKQKIAYNFAMELEKILVVENFNELDLDSFSRATDCMSFNMLGTDIGLIENSVFDTDEKIERYINFNNFQSGKFFGGDAENLDCTFK